MIAYYLGGWFYMAAIFSGVAGGVKTFEVFVSIGTVFLIVGFLYGMVTKGLG